MKRSAESMQVEDYGFCEDCQMFFDLWKYDCIEDTGHEGCNWRYVTEEELIECVKGCQEEGCFDEEFL